MRPVDIQQIGGELAIKWSDGGESFIRLDALRRSCPCAGCQGERDVMGRLHKGPEQPLTAASFELKRYEAVGGYALQPFWGDGHNTGLYTFAYLRHLAPAIRRRLRPPAIPETQAVPASLDKTLLHMQQEVVQGPSHKWVG